MTYKEAFRKAAEYGIVASLSPFLHWIAMKMYGDTTTTDYAVMMLGVYCVCCAAICLGISYIIPTGRDAP